MAPEAPIHILVVDDEPLATAGLERFLVRRGYRVTTAGDGREGLERFNSDPADVVVTDVRMPRLDGRDMIRALREENPSLLIIGVTGHRSVDDKGSVLKAGADMVLRKPLDLREIRDVLDALTERKKA